MGKINIEKVYEQKKYLLLSLRDACEAINGLGFENKFGEPLSFSKFYRFISSKKQILLQKDIPDTSMFNNLLFCNNNDVTIYFFGKMLVNKNFFEKNPSC